MHNYAMVSSICLLCIVWTPTEAVVLWGSCPNISVQQNFDAKKYLGVWYEQAGFNTWTSIENTRCVVSAYSSYPPDPNPLMFMYKEGVNNDTDEKAYINGLAIEDNACNREGKMSVLYYRNNGTVEGHYWVLGTDYVSYSVAYSCKNWVLFYEYSIWLLSRKRTFSTAAEKRAYDETTATVLRAEGLDPSQLNMTSQKDCDNFQMNF